MGVLVDDMVSQGRRLSDCDGSVVAIGMLFVVLPEGVEGMSSSQGGRGRGICRCLLDGECR